ncbi:hypothetical protein pmac_cds_635 [Pandoravirus macleodensis]|uniref:DUF5865 domain-containing protein n=1 Tax=Pandoravirus macleodensis TaxID=2107707 RepID=A0A2U7UFR4_9VIRU|nr:hypothetical protein pmac_cds_635 [Pandoravirus macleodensis]AVK77323.1 hypothetical protein pmac_cds_635 [Pandoravirus macleodensis]UMO80073.1 hypothetical protein [Pandoravirus aubagnensis]
MSNSSTAPLTQALADQINALCSQVEGLSAALGALALSAGATKDAATTVQMTTTAVANAQAAAAKPAVFSTASPYKSLPRSLVAGDYCTHGGSAEDESHMTLTQLLALLRKARPDATVTMGACCTPKVLRVYPASHRVHTIAGRGYVYRVAAVASAPTDPNREDTSGTFFNALQLGPQPTTVEVLIEDLDPYMRDAPDAIMLTPSGLASLTIKEDDASQGTLPVLTRRQLNDFVECDLNPFDTDPAGNNAVDEIVATAKAQLAARRPLAAIATDLGRAFASGGLAAVDLFYVPAARTRAAADITGVNHTDYGSLLTLAEFRRTHGRTITDAHIQAFYRPVAPADVSQPVSPLARVLSSGCTNIADLYALLDDHALSH